MLEPRPTPEFRSGDARDYDKLMRQPGFLCFRAAKDIAPARPEGPGPDSITV